MSFIFSNSGISGDSYVLTASTDRGKTLFDEGGIDTLRFTDAAPVLTRQQSGVMGFWRLSTNLLVDLDQDGKLNDWSDDLTISNFFADSYDTAPGSGFIETIGNLSGTDILGLDLLDYIQGGSGNDSYVMTVSTSIDRGKTLSDDGGTDALRFTDAAPVLSKISSGVMGFGRFSTSLYVDLDRDGEIVWTEDLTIFNFFAESNKNAAGTGFIETVGNIAGADILKLDFSTFYVGGDRSDVLIGKATNDTLVGGAGDDRLDGGAGNDTIRGGTEADLIVGGTGADLLTGGEGADDFQFGSTSRSRQRSTGKMSIDRITDFERGEDSIVLSKSTFGSVKRSDFRTVRTIAQARNSKAEIIYIQKTGALFYNQNGAAKGFGSGGKFADLTNGLALTANNFSIIP